MDPKNAKLLGFELVYLAVREWPPCSRASTWAWLSARTRPWPSSRAPQKVGQVTLTCAGQDEQTGRLLVTAEVARARRNQGCEAKTADPKGFYLRGTRLARRHPGGSSLGFPHQMSSTCCKTHPLCTLFHVGIACACFRKSCLRCVTQSAWSLRSGLPRALHSHRRSLKHGSSLWLRRLDSAHAPPGDSLEPEASMVLGTATSPVAVSVGGGLTKWATGCCERGQTHTAEAATRPRGRRARPPNLREPLPEHRRGPLPEHQRGPLLEHQGGPHLEHQGGHRPEHQEDRGWHGSIKNQSRRSTSSRD